MRPSAAPCALASLSALSFPIYVFSFGATVNTVSRKSQKIAALIESCRGKSHDPHYLGYFECFNRGLFYEAHDVLEELWLADRNGPAGAFYKGLIQFAGAFVHLQKDRLRPAAALFKLARANLQPYEPAYQSLNVGAVLSEIEQWLHRLDGGGFRLNPLKTRTAPEMTLSPHE